jgi:CRP-like cAMP-binding protein
MANEVNDPVLAESALRSLVNNVGLFANIPEELILNLRTAARIITFNPDETILTQGEMNGNLYFLIIGTVDIYVDGGLVATLRRKGDLLGEMSVITNKPCSATIVAQTPVELIYININEFKKVSQSQDQLEHILYRIYSTILTDKLYLTNQKAKKLEETFTALERAKIELQEMNSQLERRVIERTQNLQSKFDGLMNVELVDLKKSLLIASDQAQGEMKTRLQQTMLDVDAVTHALEPIVEKFNVEVSLKNKKLLLAQGEKKSQTISKLALGGTGIQIFPTQSPDEVLNVLSQQNPDLVMVDMTAIDNINSYMKLSPKSRFVLLLNSSVKENFDNFRKMEIMPNLVTLNDNDRSATIRELMTTVTKAMSANMFGIEKYLNVGAQIQERRVTSSEERLALNQEMQKYFTDLSVRRSVLDPASTVLEELLMNSIYDAPTDEHGRPKYNMLPRTTPVILKANEYGILRYACDGNLLGISMEDPFGALTVNTLLKYLESCYRGAPGVMQEGKGGAGRGLHQILENSDFVVFNIRPGKKTEAIAFFDMVPGKKEMREPMLHYFSQ